MRLTFLGTSGSMPTKDRNVTSIALQRDGELILFDAGEGTQRQMAYTKVSPMKIDAIFLSHFHGDHFLGIPGLVQTLSLMERERELKIYGPPQTEEKISRLLSIPSYTLQFEIMIQDLKPGEEIRGEGYRIKTAEIDHSVPGVAYALVEDRRPGKFHPEKAKKLGIQPGPKYSRLQKGETVELPDGRVVEPDQVLGPKRSGRKVAYSGDTRPSERIVKLAEKADVLIHEGTFEAGIENDAHENGHSTVTDAARIAKRASVKKLILTHASPRYDDLDELEAQAREIFPNTKFAQDLMKIEVEFRE